MISNNLFIEKMRDVYDKARFGITHRGVLLDKRDQSKLKSAFFLWMHLLWDLADPIHHSSLFSHIPQLYYKLGNCDIEELTIFLDDCRSVLYNRVDNFTIIWSCFKGRNLGGSLFSGHLIMPVESLECDDDVVSSKSINSFLSFIGKLNILLPIEDELALTYIEDDERLSNLSFDPQDVAFLQKKITTWFKDFTFDDQSQPRHGPGAVSGHGRISIFEKYQELDIDLRLEYFLRRTRSEWELDYPIIPYHKLDRVSEVVFVPKSLKTYRTICKEPCSLQYWQQYVSQQIMTYVSRHPILHRVIDFQDQSASREFARVASKNRDYATIDLSKASDSVSYALIKEVFRKTPLLAALIGTRSDRVIVRNNEYSSSKFAPMGSALCFPIECILFAAICELAIDRSSKKHRRYRVYGDDIIIHHSHVPNLFGKLSRLGFSPNMTKSYFQRSQPYRESCGIEAYNGFDISPIRLPRNFNSHVVAYKGENVPCLIDLANRLFSEGCSVTRKVILDSIRVSRFPDQLYTVPHGIGIWSYQPTNFHLRSKMIAGQRCYNYTVLISRAEVTHHEYYDDVRLHEWFRQNGSPDGPVHIGYTKTAMRKRYIPAWFCQVENL